MERTLQFSEMEERIKSLETLAASQAAQIAKMEALIKYYEEQFMPAKRRQFGQSSERSPDQLRFDNMFNEAEDQADASLPEPAFEQITVKRKKRAGKRKDDLLGLPVERVDYELPEAERICPECGELRRDIGVTVRDELKIIPAQVVRVEHATHTYACGNCEKNSDHTPIVKSAAPTPLICGSLASPSAVAYIAAQKYVNGIPLYRVEKGFTYDGVVLSRQTMANWLIYCAQNYLIAMYSLLIALLLKEDVVHSDDTSVQVLHEPGRNATSKSCEWLYRTGSRSDNPIVIYEYKETRNQEHPKAFLKGFKGYLCCDGYQVYHNLPTDIIVVGCWAHARRYWEKTYEALPKEQRDGSVAELGLVYCNLLFAYEHEFRDLEPEARYKKRLEFSKPVSDDFFEWAASLNALPKSLLGEAVTYALNQRQYLENIYLDGRLEISNNLSERSIKPFVQGRKQWLFSNTPNGAETSSIFYSLFETAKENRLNPARYIEFLLEQLPNTKDSDLEPLTPWSVSLPDYCRAPIKASNFKPQKPMYSNKGPLDVALNKLREKFRLKLAISGVG